MDKTPVKKRRPRPVAAVILAAGKGVRMKSQLPKVVIPLAGKPLIHYVLDACRQARIKRTILVVGHRSDLVRNTLGSGYEYAEQLQQLGTGHALMAASQNLKGYKGDLLVLAGDTPFLTGQILRQLIARHQKSGAAATFLTAFMDPPLSYGRILRDAAGHILRIVENRDATPEQKKITEVNTSHYCFQAKKVIPVLARLRTDNDQGEYYLTDVIELLIQGENPVETLTCSDSSVLMGINSHKELAKANAVIREKLTSKWMETGVSFIDPSSVYIEPDVKIGPETVIHPFTSLMGKTTIGSNCTIGPQVKLIDAHLGDEVRIEFSTVENRSIEAKSLIGPFAYISGE